MMGSRPSQQSNNQLTCGCGKSPAMVTHCIGDAMEMLSQAKKLKEHVVSFRYLNVEERKWKRCREITWYWRHICVCQLQDLNQGTFSWRWFSGNKLFLRCQAQIFDVFCCFPRVSRSAKMLDKKVGRCCFHTGFLIDGWTTNQIEQN